MFFDNIVERPPLRQRLNGFFHRSGVLSCVPLTANHEASWAAVEVGTRVSIAGNNKAMLTDNMHRILFLCAVVE